jgi:hypothetical protein
MRFDIALAPCSSNSGVIPGRRAAASPESIITGSGY